MSHPPSPLSPPLPPRVPFTFPNSRDVTHRVQQIKGIVKLGGRVELKSHVEEIIVENGKAVGVRLRSGNVVRARKAVVSNASVWDTIG